MTDHENLPIEETEEEVEVFTLTDEETGEEEQYELLGAIELDGKTYYAMVPYDSDSEEYVILRVEEDGDEVTLSTIDDDEEFDRVADAIEDQLFDEVDYDAEGAN